MPRGSQGVVSFEFMYVMFTSKTLGTILLHAVGWCITCYVFIVMYFIYKIIHEENKCWGSDARVSIQYTLI